MNTPNSDNAASQAISSHHTSCWPVARYSAGTADTRPEEAM